MKREDWDKRYAATDLLWSADPNQFLVAEVAGVEPGRACDVACGEGRNAIWLAEKGWQVVAVDFSPIAVDKARQLAASREVVIDWHTADVRENLPSAQSFDLVLMFYLHMPWSDMRAALRHATDALAPGGTFLLVGHDSSNLEHGHGGPQDPAVLYGPDQVAAQLGGLVVEKAERVRRQVKPRSDRATHVHPGKKSDEPVFAIDNLVRAVLPTSVPATAR
ncbi:MAG: methyltransferase domain-containing protein [Proteobacteria bacterium]|nr:methyltransferase domain-containing protein [Pseudomonadota bacterium]